MCQLLELPRDLLIDVLFLLSPYCLARLGETTSLLQRLTLEDAFWIVLLQKHWPEFFATNAIPEPRSLFARMLGATSPTPPQAWPVDPSGVRILIEITNIHDGRALRLSYRLSELEFREDVVIFGDIENEEIRAYVLPIPVQGNNAWLTEHYVAIGSRMKLWLLNEEYRVLRGELASWNKEHRNEFRISPPPKEARTAAQESMQNRRYVKECWLSFDLRDQAPGGDHLDDGDFDDSALNANGDIELAMVFEEGMVSYRSSSTTEPLCPDAWDETLEKELNFDTLSALPWQ